MIAAVVLWAAQVWATSILPPATMKDLAQVWMGGDRSHIWYSRLELDANGTGSLIIQYLPMYPPRAYRVTRARLAEYELRLDVAPIDAEAESIYVRGKAYPGQLELTIGGTSGLWKSQVTFEPADRIMSKIEAVNQRAKELSGR